MATTAPFVNLLRQLARAKDDYRTGALDITWDGGKASLFLVFGQPTHAVLETADGDHVEGPEALDALASRLPSRFSVSSWRKVVVRSETLSCTLEELMQPFAQMAGAASPSAGGTAAGDGAAAVPGEPEVDFGLEDFPLLPLGPSLWADASASVVHLGVLVPTLPDALVVLTGPKLRAAGIVVGHRLVDAVWVDDAEQFAGEAAAMALMGARDGSVSGYCLESPEIAEALTMLWRCPVAFRGLPAPWIDLDGALADIERHHRDCALVVNGKHRAVALLSAGRLLAVYTDGERQPAADRKRLASALRVPGASLELREPPQARPMERLPESSFHSFVAPTGTVTAPAARDAIAGTAAAAPGPPSRAPAPASPAAPARPTPTAATPEAPAPAPASPAAAARPAPTAVTPEAPASRAGAAGRPAPTRPAASQGNPATAAAARPIQASAAATASAPAPGTAGPVPPAARPRPAAQPVSALSAWGHGHAPGQAPPGSSAPLRAPDAPAEPLLSVRVGSDRDLQPPDAAPSMFTDAAPDWEATVPHSAGGSDDPFGAPPAVQGPDYEAVKADLIQIAALWLGRDDLSPVAEMIRATKPSIAAFLSTIEAVKALSVPGHETSVIRAMAREMHYHAAEYLSGV